MEAIVLAGGFGTRLRSVVGDRPKVMAPIGNRPFLEILLSSLACNGFRRAVLSLGYMADLISSYFGDHFAGMEISYVVEEVPLGTGGAVRLAMEQSKAEHVFVFNGDTFLDLEAGDVERLWQQNKNPIIVGREVVDTSRYGMLEVKEGRVCRFIEKRGAGAGLVNVGCYVMAIEHLAGWPLNVPFSLEVDHLANLVKVEVVDFFETQGLFVDIGVPEDLELARKLIGV